MRLKKKINKSEHSEKCLSIFTLMVWVNPCKIHLTNAIYTANSTIYWASCHMALYSAIWNRVIKLYLVLRTCWLREFCGTGKAVWLEVVASVKDRKKDGKICLQVLLLQSYPSQALPVWKRCSGSSSKTYSFRDARKQAGRLWLTTELVSTGNISKFIVFW